MHRWNQCRHAYRSGHFSGNRVARPRGHHRRQRHRVFLRERWRQRVGIMEIGWNNVRLAHCGGYPKRSGLEHSGGFRGVGAIANIGGILYFAADDGSGLGLWRSGRHAPSRHLRGIECKAVRRHPHGGGAEIVFPGGAAGGGGRSGRLTAPRQAQSKCPVFFQAYPNRAWVG